MSDLQLTSRFKANFQDPGSRVMIIFFASIVVIGLLFVIFQFTTGPEEVQGVVGGQAARAPQEQPGLVRDPLSPEDDRIITGAREEEVDQLRGQTRPGAVLGIDEIPFGEIDRPGRQSPFFQRPDGTIGALVRPGGAESPEDAQEMEETAPPPVPMQPSFQPVYIPPSPNIEALMLAAIERTSNQIAAEDHVVNAHGNAFSPPPESPFGPFPPGTGEEEEEDLGKLLVAPGDLLFGHFITETVSTENSPAMVEISAGPLRGWRLIGSFQQYNHRMVVRFNRITARDGRSATTDVLAVHPETIRSGIASRSDAHFFERVVLTSAAAFVRGFADVLAQTSETVIITDGVPTTSSPAGGTSEALSQGISDVGDVIFEEVQANASQYQQPTVTIDQGAFVGLLFLQALHEPEGPTRQSGSAMPDFMTITSSP